MSYPKADNKKLQKLANVLIRYLDNEGVEFCFGEMPISSKEVCSHFGCLSLFLIEAQEKYEKIYNNLYTVEDLMATFGKKIKELNFQEDNYETEYLNSLPKERFFPIEYHVEAEKTFFGFVPRLPEDIPTDFFMLSHFTQYTMEEYIKIYKDKKLLLINGKIPLDPLYEKMELKMNAKKIELVPVRQNNIKETYKQAVYEKVANTNRTLNNDSVESISGSFFDN